MEYTSDVSIYHGQCYRQIEKEAEPQGGEHDAGFNTATAASQGGCAMNKQERIGKLEDELFFNKPTGVQETERQKRSQELAEKLWPELLNGSRAVKDSPISEFVKSVEVLPDNYPDLYAIRQAIEILQKQVGSTGIPEETPAPQIKTMDVVSKFLDSKRNDLAEGSLRKYLGSFKTFSKEHPYLPMTPEPIEGYLAKRPASSSKRYLYALLSELYQFAHDRLGISNVIERIKRPRKGKSKESDYLTVEQLKALLAASDDDRLTGMVMLMSGLGFRRSEIHQANVGDIFDGKIRVHGKEAEESLPLLPEIRDLLLKQAAGRSGKQPLFVTRTTGRRVGVDQINKIVNRLFKQAGVNSVRPSPHTLRHTYCTLMQAAGCDRISVELLMRHRTQNTTDVYTHTSAEQKLELLRPKLEHFSLIRLVNGHKLSITGNNR